MTVLFHAPTRLESWLEATEHLLKVGGQDLNIVLSIASPESDGPHALEAYKLLNSFYASEEEYSMHTVAETIFPGWEYSKRGMRGVFETYKAEYDTLKKGDPSRWGTYANRMISRRTGDGKTINPLNELILKMQKSQQGRGTYKACYEIGIAEGEYDLPLYNTVDDQKRRRGLPCLSHLSFKLLNDHVHLTAIYRSHDYRYKVPGNLLGLARLQACVAQEVGASIGVLVVHSTYGWISGSKSRLQEVIKNLRAL